MIYEYKGNKYMVLDAENVKMKDPKTGHWIEAVVYCPDPGDEKLKSTERSYVRMKTDFEHKFKLVL